MEHLHGVKDVLTATQGLELSCTHSSRVSVRVCKPQPVLIPLRRISARTQVAAEHVEGNFHWQQQTARHTSRRTAKHPADRPRFHASSLLSSQIKC